MATRKSILLVTVDCLRADHVGFMGYGRPTTPFLDSLARESFVFPSAIVAGAPTYYSLPSLFASRYPLAFGRDVLGVGPEEPTLASALKDGGYATAALSAANPYISSQFGYQHGFEEFHDFLQQEIDRVSEEGRPHSTGNGFASRFNRKLQEVRPALGPLGRVYDELYFEYCQRVIPKPSSLDALRRFPSADIIVDHACRWVESMRDRPFFLWLHLMDPHSPYYPKQDALALMGSEPVSPFRARYVNSYWNRADLGATRLARCHDEIVALYDAGIRWVDAQVGRLVEMLRSTGRWESCVFAATADHGEEFLDHGGRYHPPLHLREELIRVPLLLRVPERKGTTLGKSPFSMIHLAPTLLDAVELPVPPEFEGRSYWREMQSGNDFGGLAISECVSGCTNPIHREGRLGPRVLSLRESRFKLVLEFDRGREELYDLDSDSGEQAPLSPMAQKPVRRRLLEAAREHLSRSSVPRSHKTQVRMRLRDLRAESEKAANPA